MRVRDVVHATWSVLLRGRDVSRRELGTAARKSRTVTFRRLTFGAWRRVGASDSGVAPGPRPQGGREHCAEPRPAHVATVELVALRGPARVPRRDHRSPDLAVPSPRPPSSRNAGRDLPRHRSGAKARPRSRRAESRQPTGTAWRPGPGLGAPMLRAVAGIPKARHALDGEEVAPAGEVPAASAPDGGCAFRPDGGRGGALLGAARASSDGRPPRRVRCERARELSAPQGAVTCAGAHDPKLQERVVRIMRCSCCISGCDTSPADDPIRKRHQDL